MATEKVPLQPQRVTLSQPDPQSGEQVMTKEWYRTVEQLVKQLNDLQARVTALES